MLKNLSNFLKNGAQKINCKLIKCDPTTQTDWTFGSTGQKQKVTSKATRRKT